MFLKGCLFCKGVLLSCLLVEDFDPRILLELLWFDLGVGMDSSSSPLLQDTISKSTSW